jgi:hypothetical protein
MAKVTHHPSEDGLATITGIARTLNVSFDGSQYEIWQFAHIDDSGTRKRREWGSFASYSEAIEAAKIKADSQY